MRQRNEKKLIMKDMLIKIQHQLEEYDHGLRKLDSLRQMIRM